MHTAGVVDQDHCFLPQSIIILPEHQKSKIMESVGQKKREPHDGKKVFREKGTCSQTFFYLFDRQFDQLKATEERASDSLAGGILQRGYQCGMLWGSALAIGAEAYRRCDDLEMAMRVAIHATQQVMSSFAQRESTINCRDITRCDFSSKWSFAKYFFSGRFLHCFKLAQQWAPDAIEVALESLEVEIHSKDGKESSDQNCMNCASLVAEKLGANEEEMVMVAGFAGGLGLSGGGCGALSAAIWMRSLFWCREHEGKNSFKNPEAVRVVEAFEEVTNDRLLCSELTGQYFKSLDEHADFILRGGCQDLIQSLTEAP